MTVGLSFGTIVPVGVVLNVVVIVVVLVSISVPSFVSSSLWFDNWCCFTLVIESGCSVLLWLDGSWLVRSVCCWFWLWLNRFFPASAVTTVVGSSLFWLSLSGFDFFQSWGWHLRETTHPARKPIWLLSVRFFGRSKRCWFWGDIGWLIRRSKEFKWLRCLV